MKKLLNYFLVVVSFFGMISCGSGIKGLYISGYTMSMDPASSTVGLPSAYYWKDGGKEALSPGKYGLATSTFGSGTDVYISGLYVDTDYTHACYWKNGELVLLDSGGTTANAASIYVNGEDVYVAGFHTDAVSGKFVATYWKNGTMSSLEPGTDNSMAAAITVSGSDVYVVGTGEGGGGKAVYWKNGTKVVLAASNAMAMAIQIVGTDVYVAGGWDEGPGSQAVYWKNGTVTRLVGGASQALASSIQVVGTDVYVAGLYSEFTKVAYWKNDTIVDLAFDSTYSTAGDGIGFINGYPIIMIHEADVHVICVLTKGTAATLLTLVSGYWVNGSFTHSEDTEAYSGLYWF